MASAAEPPAVGGLPARVVALWTAPPLRLELAGALLAELAVATRAEPGCSRFDVFEVEGRPGRFVLLEEYRDAEALAAHRASEHFCRLVLEAAVSGGIEREVMVLAPPTSR